MCSAPRSFLKKEISEEDRHLYKHRICFESPTFGNQSLVTNKYCQKHIHLRLKHEEMLKLNKTETLRTKRKETPGGISDESSDDSVVDTEAYKAFVAISKTYQSHFGSDDDGKNASNLCEMSPDECSESSNDVEMKDAGNEPISYNYTTLTDRQNYILATSIPPAIACTTNELEKALLEEIERQKEQPCDRGEYPCRRLKNMKKVFARTLGIVAWVTADGFILDIHELFCRETATQILLSLQAILSSSPERDAFKRKIKAVGYDIACMLCPRARTLVAQGLLNGTMFSEAFLQVCFLNVLALFA